MYGLLKDIVDEDQDARLSIIRLPEHWTFYYEKEKARYCFAFYVLMKQSMYLLNLAIRTNCSWGILVICIKNVDFIY